MSICSIKDCGNGTYGLKKWKSELCSQHGCNFGTGQCICDPPFILIPFPTERKDPDARKQWTKLVGRKDAVTNKNWEPNKYSRICSKHFVDGQPTTAHPYPTEHLGHKVKVVAARRTIQKHEMPKKEKKTKLPLNELESNVSTHEQEATFVSCDEIAGETVLPKSDLDYAETLPQPLTHDHTYAGNCDCSPDCTCQGCFTKQVTINQMKSKLDLLSARTEHVSRKSASRHITNMVTSDNEKVRLYTGLPNAGSFTDLYRHLLSQARHLVYWKGVVKVVTKVPRKFKKVPQKPGPKRKLSIKDEMLMTLMKLRLGLGNDFLGDIFLVSPALCSQVLNTWIKFLAYELKPLIYWPAKEVVLRTLPDAYKTFAPKLRCIIDCTEMFIDRPRDMEMQGHTYSDYKRHNTLKFLVAIAPNGAISYISEAWGGRASDRFIVQESGFLDLIEPTDEVMADRGFPIKSDLVMKMARLIIPPPGQGAEQMTPEGVLRTKVVANMRIHVERAIGRLKYFQILKQTLPISLTPLANDIVTICAGIVNLLPPLVK
ncbi:PREDICTED: uncharacterized protein LOC106818335 [Priapulus caudatus]|uniref:Uncharacterized protein LOC106818335 n=1 Tax=Priapulus caudatus TaxID=37621 RepID=A0ABM1F265_PRICU|nr:PREDICTED: uncharacterized protein LOC106818335 [Priapulus caudatus]